LVAEAEIRPDDLVIEIGPGRGALTFPLARRAQRVIALEKDPELAQTLRDHVQRRNGAGTAVTVLCCDALGFRFPRRRPFRVVGSVPFGETTAIMRRLLENPRSGLERADLIVQWEVALKRTVQPPTNLLSTSWTPWWTFELGRRIPASAFRPVPSVDAAVLRICRRDPPLLPPDMAVAYHDFVRRWWQ
jgi:23S rRNA (adenine-N6)-dimethyltransferase